MRLVRGPLVVVLCSAAAVCGPGAVLAQEGAAGVDITVQAGAQFTRAVATFEWDVAEPERFGAAIAWGDGSPRSAGTVVLVGGPDAGGLYSYEVRGTHLYGAAGSYTVQTTISRPPGTPVVVSSTATVTPAPGPPPVPPPGASAQILGGSEVTLGEPVRMIASVNPPAVRHQWDVDGDGAYELDRGADPAVDADFPHAGGFTVGLRATLADGAVLSATRRVEVLRPPVMGLDAGLLNPRPGRRVRLKLELRKEKGTGLEVFAWKIAGVKPRRRSLLLPARGGEPAQLVRLAKGWQPTRKPVLPVTFRKPGAYPIVVRALDDQSHGHELHATIVVAKGVPKKPIRPSVVNCDKADASGLACPQVFVRSEPATQVKTFFSFVAPSAQACVFTGATLDEVGAVARIDAVFDLPYPAPEGFGAVASRRRPPERARAAIEKEKDCVEAEPAAIEWDFGDGTKLTAPPGGSLPDLVHHVYAQAGKYTAAVTVRVPQFVASGKAKKSNKASDFYDLVWRSGRKTIPVEVEDAHCGTLSLNGIPVSSTIGTAGKDIPGLDVLEVGARGCFLPAKTLDGKAGLWKTFNGYDLDLNTMTVRSNEPGIVVDQKNARIQAPPAGLLDAFFEARVGQAERSIQALTGRKQIEVPSPKFDAELGGPVAALPSGYGGGSFLGLPVTAIHAFLAPNRGALARIFLDPPAPVGGGSRPIVVGGGPAALSSGLDPNEPADVTMQLQGLDLGLFEVEDFTIGHRPSGGWFGGGTLRIPALNATFLAPYRSPPDGDVTSKKCAEVDGPSGIALDDGGDFLFGGFAAKTSIPLGGVIELTCVAVRGQATPFVMVGKVGARIPPGGPFGVDGCFLMTVLSPGQKAAGCAASLTAGSDLVWFRAEGTLGVFGDLTLGGAYLDIRAAPGSKQGGAGGSTGFDEGPIYGSLKVDGHIVLDSGFAFDLIGSANVCYDAPDEIPGDEDICAGGSAGVSTKGFGACAGSIGGFAVYWSGGGDIWIFDCELDDAIGVAMSTFGRPVSAPGPLLAPAQGGERRVRLRRGLRRVGFVVSGEGGPAVPVVTGPGGSRIADDGSGFARTRGYRITRAPDGRTGVIVERPRGGVWTVAAAPGTPQLRDLDLLGPSLRPRVRARLLGRGARSVLAWRARLAPADRVRFVEVGRGLSRALGGLRRSGRGRIRLRPVPGAPGRRTVLAVVERNGIVSRRIRVARYRAPRPARPAAPRRLRLRLVRARGRVGWRSELRVAWRRAPAARNYRVAVRLSDGRTFGLETRRPSLQVAAVDRGTAARVRVTPLGADGRPGRTARGRLRAASPRRARIRL